MLLVPRVKPSGIAALRTDCQITMSIRFSIQLQLLLQICQRAVALAAGDWVLKHRTHCDQSCLWLARAVWCLTRAEHPLCPQVKGELAVVDNTNAAVQSFARVNFQDACEAAINEQIK
jgi:hypothetical protein